MRVIILFRGPISEHLDKGALMIEGEDCILLKDIIRRAILDEDYLRRTWRNPEEMDRDALILLNGKDIGLTGGLQSTLNDGDILTVLPLVHGG